MPWVAFLAIITILTGCVAPAPAPTAISTLPPSPTATAITPTPTLAGTLPVWGLYDPPVETPATPIPPPLSGIAIDDEVKVLALIGIDQPSPRSGRSDAIMLLFFHPRLARASLLSLPPDLLVFIPGLGMQRLNTAYASGGITRFLATIEYNFGVRPDYYAIAPLDAFTYFVDDLGGLEVYNLTDLPDLCNLPPGRLQLDGQAVLCYVRYRSGTDEAERNRRQQEIVHLIIQRMAESGNLSRLPQLYQEYHTRVSSNLRWTDLLGYLSLALQLGDHNRLGFFTLGSDDLSLWNIPGNSPGMVFITNRSAVSNRIQAAADFVLTAQPFTERLMTLEAQLTAVPSPTATLPATPTFPPPPTAPPPPTVTLSPTGSVTPTVTLTPTPTPTETTQP